MQLKLNPASCNLAEIEGMNRDEPSSERFFQPDTTDRRAARSRLLPASGQRGARDRDPHLLGIAGRALRVQDQESAESGFSRLQPPARPPVLLRRRNPPEPPAGAAAVSGCDADLRQPAAAAAGNGFRADRVCGQDAPLLFRPATGPFIGARPGAATPHRQPGRPAGPLSRRPAGRNA